MKLHKVINKGTDTEQTKEYNIEECLDLALNGKISKPLILKGIVDSNKSITFNTLGDKQKPYETAYAAYEAGRVVQIDVTNPAEDWNTILTLSRVDMGGLQFFNYEKTINFEEDRLQYVLMWPDSTATYNYILVSGGSTGVVPTIGDNGNWYIGSTDTGKPSRGEKGNTGPQGAQGVGITDIRLESGHLIVTLENGTEIDAGIVPEQFLSIYGGTLQGNLDMGDNAILLGGIGSISALDTEEIQIRAETGEGVRIGDGVIRGIHNIETDYDAVNKKYVDDTVNSLNTYSKPAGGIPKSDLANDIQTSLGKADTALQKHQSLAAYRTAAEQDVIDNKKQDVIADLTTIRNGAAKGATALQSVPATYRKAADQDAIDATKQSIITDLETIRSGAALGATAVQPEAGKGLFSGSYKDLTDKPTIPDISGKQDKLIAGEGITIAADGKTISSSGKVSSVNGKTGTVNIYVEDIHYAKGSQKLDVTIAGLKAADTQMASDISKLQSMDALLDKRITVIETGDTPVTLYIYWSSIVGTGRVSLTKNGTAMSVTDFISKIQSGAKIIIGENNDEESESQGSSNYRYKITDSITASLAFDVANSFNGSNRTIIISGSSSTDGLMCGYQDIAHDDLLGYSPLPEGSTPASKAWVEDYVDEKAAVLQSKSITDTGGYFTTDTVEGALQEIGAELAGINTLLGSGIQISFTINDGSEVNTFSAVSGETWKEWVGPSRIISETSGLTLYCFSDDGIIFADEAGVNALGLNNTWVYGSDTVVPGATYAIIPCGG